MTFTLYKAMLPLVQEQLHHSAAAVFRCPNMEVAACETNADNEEEEDEMDKKAKTVADQKTKRKIKSVSPAGSGLLV